MTSDHATASQSAMGLYRVEVSQSSDTGKLKLAGGVSGTMKESAPARSATAMSARPPSRRWG